MHKLWRRWISAPILDVSRKLESDSLQALRLWEVFELCVIFRDPISLLVRFIDVVSG
jgi:hypothetical protein